MTGNRNLTFAVAGVALGIFGLSLQVVSSNLIALGGTILAGIGFLVALFAAATSE